MRFFVETSYVGTTFSGSQKQANAPSIQEELECALSILLQSSVTLVASSRTDAGVHAYQNVFHLEQPQDILQRCNVHSLNSILPHSISVNKLYKVDDTMHARFSAKERKYLYLISLKKEPFLYQKAYHYTAPLDIDLLQATSEIIRRQLCFLSFSKKHSQVSNHSCTIHNAAWKLDKEKHLLTFSISANRFLRGMVRAIVATQLDVARNAMTIQDFMKLFQEPHIASANFAAPAEGLYLKHIIY